MKDYKVVAWSWCADCCKKNQWNPHDSYFWDKAMLKYRREHNIFDVGDSIVFDISKPFCAKLQSDLMEVINPKYQEHDMIVRINNQIYIVGGKAVRHATDAEIKAGKRL